ncbi:putative (S)-N-methylcoclaurine 3'-hydroxylase isozyme 2 [Dorcoceras hygrometricum]|uniref:Putative (S)-N-methylcoclaurine 3'-hydroxylase isozyme 2 n=1 Tax=Dorcoceras hygrometricum TaxID=472368 RepID=A0A2Z7BUW3_9LAMI|nr:putative (S)-N-methylcoclaurine 3'-hydroxylase isozyme 2 [Dorcoceras hygrometricum]
MDLKEQSSRQHKLWEDIGKSARAGALPTVARDQLLRSDQLLVSDQQWLASDVSSGSLCDVVLFSYSLIPLESGDQRCPPLEIRVLTSESRPLNQNAAVPNNPNDVVYLLATETR